MAVDQDTKRGDRAVTQSAAVNDVGVLDTDGNLINPATEESLTATQGTRFGQSVQVVSDPEQAERLTEISNTLTKIEMHLRHMTGVAYGEQ